MRTGPTFVACLAVTAVAIAALPGIAWGVDFARDVQPILVSRCVRCHGPDKQEGGLRLDTREHALVAGDSGAAVIETPLDQNELWRRVASSQAEVRMPLDGPPLSETELERLEAWVTEGARWPTTIAPPVVATSRPWSIWIDARVKAWQPLLVRLRPALLLGTGVLIVLLVLSLVARRRVLAAPWWRSVARVATPSSYLLVVLGVVIYGAIVQAQLHRERVATLEMTLAEVRRDVTAAHDRYKPPTELVRPPQPRGVQRVYYRGNDERSPQLYNGGYYRTATIELHLVDAAGERIDIGSRCASGPLLLTIDIHRAAGATPILFSDELAHRTFLSPLGPDEPITDHSQQVIPLEIVASGEHWRVTAPVGEVSSSGTQTIAGRRYLMHGPTRAAEATSGVAHFGIEFRLQLEDGVVQPGSDLWMAALLHAAPTIATPPNMLHTSEWFDFRPIPEIEGENASDPKLIGTPKHSKAEGR